MASTRTPDFIVERSGSSVHGQDEAEFHQQHDESPLDINNSTPSNQPISSHVATRGPLDAAGIKQESHDEPPPPYEEFANEPQIAPIEYSCENSPQLLVAPQSEFPEVLSPPPRNPARLDSGLPEVSPVQSPYLSSPSQASLVPAPLSIQPASPRSLPRRPVSSTPIINSFSSAKAREAGFELTDHIPVERSSSLSSSPSITLVSSTEALRHVREPGKLKAYLIPFPKPRMKGIKPEDMPDRFLVYTPPAPPLSKPAPGEKENQWHKTQRMWQEDVRKATMTHASKATWKGIKARSTILIGKGVAMTRSSNLEFLDRVSDGAITTSTTDESQPPELEDTTSSISQPPSSNTITTPSSPQSTDSNASSDKAPKPKSIEELTLIYPPTLALTPEQIRKEFIDNLLRTRDKSRKDAVIASALFPLAAAIDASVLITFGGLMEVSGVWAYTSIRGAKSSKRMTQGLAYAQQQAVQEQEGDTKADTHHESFSSKSDTITKSKGKATKTGITLRMQQSFQMEILRRYLDIACLKKDFNMFPQLDETVGDVNEAAVLEAIGWAPTRRTGRDLEMEVSSGKIEHLTAQQDEQWQIKEAREDVRRIMKKGAAEWVQWCKSFAKDSQSALKK